MNKSLATTVKQKSPPDTSMRTGVITAMSGVSVTVNVAGADVDASVLESYSPAIGDTVVLMRTEATWMVLGHPRAGASAKVASGQLLGGKLFTSSDTKLSGFTSEALVADYDITISMPEKNLVLVRATFFYTSTTGDVVLARIRQGSLSGTVYGQVPLKVYDAASSYVGEVNAWVEGDGTSTSWVLTAELLSGSGTATITTDFTQPTVFIGEKVGSMEALTVV